MATLQNVDGASLSLDLSGLTNEIGARQDRNRKEEAVQRDIGLVRTASGLSPNSPAKRQEAATGFLDKLDRGLSGFISGLNKNRDPDQIDQTRAEAQSGIDTGREILAASTQKEKQAIALRQARKAQDNGGDFEELARKSGGTSSELDLLAQKALLTGEAALSALPAPTSAERENALAELSVRNATAANFVMKQQAIARQEEQRQQAMAQQAQNQRANASAKAQAEAQAAAGEKAFFDQRASILGANDEQAATPIATESAGQPVDRIEATRSLPQTGIENTRGDLTAAINARSGASSQVEFDNADSIVKELQGTLKDQQGVAASASVTPMASGFNDIDSDLESGLITKEEADSAKSNLVSKTTGLSNAQGGPLQTRSTTPYSDGTIVAVTDAGRIVYNPAGEVVTGQDSARVIEDANAFEAEQQRLINSSREQGKRESQAEFGEEATSALASGKARSDTSVAAYKGSRKLGKSITTIDRAVSAIDAGGQAGAIQKYFPDITSASAELTNAMNNMGLDVVGAVTFGALSKGELDLAMQTAAPRNLDSVQLRDWLVTKRDAMFKAQAMLDDSAEYLSTPGNSLSSWYVKNGEANAARRDASSNESTDATLGDIPQVAIDAGVTDDLWSYMSEDDRSAFR
jgi:hypothetical protein